MTNGEKYKTDEEWKKEADKFCISNRKCCEKCSAYHPTELDCYINWLSLECKDEPETQDNSARIEREKRIQEVALQLVALTSANVAYAFRLAEEYVAECERREKVIREGGAE